MVKRLLAVGALGLGLTAGVLGGFGSGETANKDRPTLADANEAEQIAAWEGRPLIPGSGQINKYTQFGNISLKLFEDDERGNFATMTFMGPADISLTGIMTCTTDNALEISQDYSRIPNVLRQQLPEARLVEKSDFTAVVCKTGELTVNSIAAFASEPSRA